MEKFPFVIRDKDGTVDVFGTITVLVGVVVLCGFVLAQWLFPGTLF